MARKNPIEHVRALAYEIAEQNAVARALVAKCMEILSSPQPDTFLGRKTQEPFPRQSAEFNPS